MSNAAVLYITYDGLTDPLGQSQIVPYLLAVATEVQLQVISFEKESRYRQGFREVRSKLDAAGIVWTPLFFTARPKVLAKVYDLTRMLLLGLWIALIKRCVIVHCRSYVAAQVGITIKALTGAKFLFDMRGFWVNERVDSGNWDVTKPFYRVLFLVYKRIEKLLFRQADHIITLTRASLTTIAQLAGPQQLTTVIPCCADFEHFRPDEQVKTDVRKELGFRSDELIVCYLGSLGSWYQFPEMLAFFHELHKLEPRARFLLITQDWSSRHQHTVAEAGLEQSVVVLAATRTEVARYTQAADLAVSFIRPSFSKTASSPTKLAEFFALGIPVVCNDGVGDVSEMVLNLKAGWILPRLDTESYQRAAALVRIPEFGGQYLRESAHKVLGLEVAGQSYRAVYRQLLSRA